MRFVRHKWHAWATGNYLLDYEDSTRGYGGVIQTVLMANQRTGLPSVFRLTAEQHSFGTASEFEVHVKAEGLVDSVIWEVFGTVARPFAGDPAALLEALARARLSVMRDESLHFETIVKVNEQTIYCHHLNRTTFDNFAVGELKELGHAPQEQRRTLRGREVLRGQNTPKRLLSLNFFNQVLQRI